MKSNPDAATVFCDTHTLTEVRKETQDRPERSTFLETMSKTAVRGENHDPDTGTMDLSGDAWLPGSRRPMLFGSARQARGETPKPRYDRAKRVCVDEKDRPIVRESIMGDTFTLTDARGEAKDPDA